MDDMEFPSLQHLLGSRSYVMHTSKITCCCSAMIKSRLNNTLFEISAPGTSKLDLEFSVSFDSVLPDSRSFSVLAVFIQPYTSNLIVMFWIVFL